MIMSTEVHSRDLVLSGSVQQCSDSNRDAAWPPPSTSPNAKSSRSWGCCCTTIVTLCSVLLLLIFLISVAALIFWLIVRPIHAPSYSLKDFNLNSFSITPQYSFGVTPRVLLNANFKYTLIANNRNKKIGFKYGDISIETSYAGDVFGRSGIPGFYQGHRNITTLTEDLQVKNYALSLSLASALQADVRSGSIPLQSFATTKVGVKIGGLVSFPVKVHLHCEIRVSLPTNSGPGSAIDKRCKLTR
ncbi:NDR1/HIN1-like protein 10 [Physcomitrium patens]|uniref:Late embryogenesis abundant protein LEA-2 subgroup domain-containing protein n=1 Tax=Physcomitrium patens TaxID=3218 RepID=A0A2K1IIZ5_PHYPA|nr:hypothetical protein PHYPA_027939 [Physcomitrium patens]